MIRAGHKHRPRNVVGFTVTLHEQGGKLVPTSRTYRQRCAAKTCGAVRERVETSAGKGPWGPWERV